MSNRLLSHDIEIQLHDDSLAIFPRRGGRRRPTGCCSTRAPSGGRDRRSGWWRREAPRRMPGDLGGEADRLSGLRKIDICDQPTAITRHCSLGGLPGMTLPELFCGDCDAEDDLRIGAGKFEDLAGPIEFKEVPLPAGRRTARPDPGDRRSPRPTPRQPPACSCPQYSCPQHSCALKNCLPEPCSPTSLTRPSRPALRTRLSATSARGAVRRSTFDQLACAAPGRPSDAAISHCCSRTTDRSPHDDRIPAFEP